MFTSTVIASALFRRRPLHIRRIPSMATGLTSNLFYSTSNNMIEYKEIKELLKNKNIELIDVREPEELKTDGKIPGSVNIPLKEVKGAFSLPHSKFEEKYHMQMPDVGDKNLVFSCRSGKRASIAWEIVQPFGYTNARIYYGSFIDWVENGGDIEK